VALVFDPDTAGQDAAIRTAGTFLDAGLSVRVAALPGGEDPDSFISKEGAEAFAGIVKSAQSVVGFQVQVLGRRENLKNEAAMRRAVKSVFATIARSPDSVQRDSLIQELGVAFPGVNIVSLFQEFHIQQRRGGARGKEAPEPAPAPAVPREEEELCRHMARLDEDPGLADLVRGNLRLDMISHPTARAFVTAALKAAASGASLNDMLAGIGPAEAELQEFAARVMMAPPLTRGIRLARSSVLRPEFSSADQVRGLILSMWKKRFERERVKLQQIMSERDLTPDEARHRLQLSHDIRNVRSWETGSEIIAIMMAG
jgi:DNA primase